MLIGKRWGTTECLLDTPVLAIHRLHIKPGYKCSEHCHQQKWNGFWVRIGVLFIHVVKNDYDLTDVTRLEPGEFTSVKPGEFHWFETGIDRVEAIELYYPEVLSEDIVRRSCGGPVDGASVAAS